MSDGKQKSTAGDVTTVEELPWFARAVNHIMTPGSSLTSSVWTLFNCLIAALFGVWFIFFVNFPTNPHVWVFFGLATGLAITTNIFFKEIFAAGHDFDSMQAKKDSDGAAAAQVEDKKSQ